MTVARMTIGGKRSSSSVSRRASGMPCSRTQPAHLGEAPTWVRENMRDPGYHTALGLLYYGVSSHAEKAGAARRGGGFLTGMKRLFAST